MLWLFGVIFVVVSATITNDQIIKKRGGDTVYFWEASADEIDPKDK